MAASSVSFYAVAVGDSPGVYESEEAAVAATGSHPVPLRVTYGDRPAAQAFVDFLQDVKAVVYTDGSCTQNGKPGARAGVGVFWGSDDARNVARRASGDQTNNVAELEGIEDALDTILLDDGLVRAPVALVSDSSYSINCLTKWYAGFVRRAWKTAGGDDVKNKTAIARIKAKLDRASLVRLVHVRGHVGHVGNHAADALAVAGGKM